MAEGHRSQQLHSGTEVISSPGSSHHQQFLSQSQLGPRVHICEMTSQALGWQAMALGPERDQIRGLVLTGTCP